MGAWGKEKYGMKPQKVEVLEFLRCVGAASMRAAQHAVHYGAPAWRRQAAA